MGVSEADRRQRLLDLVGVAMDNPGCRSADLGAVAMRSWALRRSSAQDYIDDLIAMGYIKLRADGEVVVLPMGERAVMGVPRDQAPKVAARDAELPPSPPPTPDGG